MITASDVLTEALRKGVYTSKKIPGQFYKFNSFGSNCCGVCIFDAQGNLKDETTRHTDSLDDYELVPDNQIPENLRQKIGQLEQAALSPADRELTDEEDDRVVT